MKLRLSWRYFLQNQNALHHRRPQYYERTILKQRFPPHSTRFFIARAHLMPYRFVASTRQQIPSLTAQVLDLIQRRPRLQAPPQNIPAAFAPSHSVASP
jgi:hypothetical protein